MSTGAVGALAGRTFAVKDNVDVAAVPTTAGCPAFAYEPERHAHVVERLLGAGAQLLGKTNLDQFACGLNGTRSPFGAVPNAVDARYVSGGSSSGSAWVVASGEADFALGTDTAGSGRIPAGLNNIVGLKPTRGLISASGVVPAAQSVDCVSIFARTVGEAFEVLQVGMGYDAQDPFSRTLRLTSRPWRGAFRFGIPAQREFFGDALAEAAFAESIARMQSLGGVAVEVDFSLFYEAAALLYESALVAERYAAIRPFFDTHADEVVEPVRTIIGKGREYSAADLVQAQLRLREIGQRVRPVWDSIDLLLVPTAPTHYTIAQMQADPIALNRNLGVYTNFVNLLDYAALSVPSTIRPDGLPFGVTLIGPAGSDWQLAELGQRYHVRTGLTLGATGLPCPDRAVPPLPGPGASLPIAVVGAHLSGMPLNFQLTERGARLLRTTRTTADYRLYALSGTKPPKPGLQRVATGEGAPIALELWDMPMEHYGSFVAEIPSPLGIGTLTLEDGTTVQGFLCESLALSDARDITEFGGWRAYLQSLAS